MVNLSIKNVILKISKIINSGKPNLEIFRYEKMRF